MFIHSNLANNVNLVDAGKRLLFTRLGALGIVCDGILRFCLPGGYVLRIRQAFSSAQIRARVRKYASLRKRNSELKNCHADKKRCFVIGAGPSLKNLDLSHMANEIWVGANYVHFHPELRGEKTAGNYCVILNPFLYEGEELLARIPIMKVTEERLPHAKMIFPDVAQEICKEHNLFVDRDVYYVSVGGRLDPDIPVEEDRFDLCSVLPQPHNVLESTILTAAYMGFKEIYLLGCDANYVEISEFKNLHFYSIEDVSEVFDVGHRKNPMGDWKQMETRAHHTFRMYQALGLINKELLKKGIRVFNASGGGMLDVFPCVKYESLFPSDSKK